MEIYAYGLFGLIVALISFIVGIFAALIFLCKKTKTGKRYQFKKPVEFDLGKSIHTKDCTDTHRSSVDGANALDEFNK